MNPVEIGRGQSFKGLSNYLLHDEQQETAERVGESWTVNMGDKIDPGRAWLHMLWTTNSADDLKRAAGVKLGGAKNDKPVFHYVLNFNPADDPTSEQMRRAVVQSLERLELGEHQAMAVEHRDKDHAHVHVMANLINPENGRTAKLSYTKTKLSKWAAEFEDAEGLVVTQGRRDNQKKRLNGEKTSNKRKTRNAYETAPKNDNRVAFLEANERGELAQLVRDGRDMEALHANEWKALKAGYYSDLNASQKLKEALVKQTVAQVKQGMKPRWAALFQQQRAEERQHLAGESTLLGLFSMMVVTYRRIRQEGGTVLTGLDAALSGPQRRAPMDAQHEEMRAEMAALVRFKIRNATRQIYQTASEYKLDRCHEYLRSSSELEATQKRRKTELQDRWRALNTKKVAAREALPERESEERTRRQKRRRGIGYRYAMRPTGPRP